MRALTLWRPWPHAITHLGKRIENRSWSPPDTVVGKYIGIHAGQEMAGDAVAAVRSMFGYEAISDDVVEAMPSQAIVAVARVTHHVTQFEEAEKLEQGQWWSGPLAWVLDDVHALQTPVPCRGYQGLWFVGRLDVLDILSQLPGVPGLREQERADGR
jgi:hypothetical protein